MRVAFQPKGPRPLFQAVSADHFPPFLFEFDPHGHKLGPKIDFMPEIDPIHYSGDIDGEFCEDTVDTHSLKGVIAHHIFAWPT